MNEHELEAVLTTLDENQQQRAEACKQARAVLLSRQAFGNSVSMFSSIDIIMLADYIMNGKNPSKTWRMKWRTLRLFKRS